MEKKLGTIKMDRGYYDDDSDWGNRRGMERQYFYRRQELSPDMNKLRKR